MSKTLILASSNQGKLKEFEEIFQGNLNFKLKTIDQISGDQDFDPEETGSTYIENARIKALAGVDVIRDCFRSSSLAMTDTLCLADDSGIEITSLNNQPGIHSGRYLRKHGLEYLAAEINATHPLDRSCKFICSLVVADLNHRINQEIQIEWHGWTVAIPRGTLGFGFDPLVIPEEEILTRFASIEELRTRAVAEPESTNQILSTLKTVAELDPAYKNTISHRAKAASKLLEKYKAVQTTQTSTDSPSLKSHA